MKRLPLDDNFKVNRNPVTLREIVLDKLRSAIMNFQLLPGDRLVERDLCERLGVSRTSVREALRHLESEGLVAFADAKGPSVAIITLADARDLYELRCALEGLIVQLFTLRAKAKDIKALEKALEENRKALKDGELQQVLDSVQGFYDVLLEGSGNHVAATQLRQLQARISYLRATRRQGGDGIPATQTGRVRPGTGDRCAYRHKRPPYRPLTCQPHASVRNAVPVTSFTRSPQAIPMSRGCGYIHYVNPKIIAGCIIERDGRYLLCQRAIAPRPGTWTLPAGFMESGETTEQAALREVWEESGVRAEIISPYSIFSVPKISEVYIIFRAIALEITDQYGPETLDYRFFAPEEIPWDSIYYPAIRQILERYIEERQNGVYGLYVGNDDNGKVHFIR